MGRILLPFIPTANDYNRCLQNNIAKQMKNTNKNENIIYQHERGRERKLFENFFNESKKKKGKPQKKDDKVCNGMGKEEYRFFTYFHLDSLMRFSQWPFLYIYVCVVTFSLITFTSNKGRIFSDLSQLSSDLTSNEFFPFSICYGNSLIVIFIEKFRIKTATFHRFIQLSIQLNRVVNARNFYTFHVTFVFSKALKWTNIW